ncbi:MAG: hypothetical protein R3F50_01110 [Gammaproteobacteria bacterium]|jgi:hypothetical protein
MKNTRLLLLLCSALSVACTVTGRPDFINMSEEDIYAHNLEQPLMKKVYCFQENMTGSYIRRRQCMTVEEYVYRLEQSVLALDVLQPSAGAGPFGVIRD